MSATDTTPSASLMIAKGIKRTISSTDTYILLAYALTSTTPSATDGSGLLTANATYSLYGMDNGSSQPLHLLDFRTNPTIATITTNSTNRYMDESLSTVTITTRASETTIIPIQVQFDPVALSFSTLTINFYLRPDTNGLQIRTSNGKVVSAIGYRIGSIIRPVSSSASPEISTYTNYYDLSDDVKSGARLEWNSDASSGFPPYQQRSINIISTLAQ